MKKINIVRCFLSLCIIATTVMLIIQVNGMQTRYPTVSVRLDSELTKKKLCEDLEKEGETKNNKLKAITAFSQYDTIIEGKDLGRKVNLTAYCIYGNVEDVLPVSLISGNLLIRDDPFGCVLTKKSAFALFGNIDVVGAAVKINDRAYLIRGIVDANTEAVLYEAGQDTDTFNCLELTIDDENGEFYANQFVNSYFLNAEYIIGENYIVRILKNIYLFPFLIVIFDVIIGAIRKLKTYHKRKGIRYLVVGVGIVIAFFICKLFGYFPKRWIPSKWSDFQHYSDIISYIKSQLHTLSFAKPIAKEVALRNDLLKAFILFTISMVGQIYLLRCINEWGSRVTDRFFMFLDSIRQDICRLIDNIKAKKQNDEEIEEIDNEKSLD
ncbi:MAG: ABC transporter permease [Clostridiales bacterium]|nr:ABC transporter permease [Clostridiales bacterium]